MLETIAGQLTRTATWRQCLRQPAEERLPSRIKKIVLELLPRCTDAYDRPLVATTAYLGVRHDDVCLTRRGLEDCGKPLVDCFVNVAEKCLSATHTGWSDIDNVVLVGPLASVIGVKELLVSWGDVDESAIVVCQSEAVAFGAVESPGKLSGGEGGLPSVGIVFREASSGRIVAEEVLRGHDRSRHRQPESCICATRNRIGLS